MKYMRMKSEPQYFFMYAKEGVVITKGNKRGMYIKELYDIDPDGLKEWLKELYEHEETNRHTKGVIEEIMEDTFGKKRKPRL